VGTGSGTVDRAGQAKHSVLLVTIAFEVYVPAGFDGLSRTAAPRPLPTSSGAGRRTRRFAPTRGSCAAPACWMRRASTIARP